MGTSLEELSFKTKWIAEIDKDFELEAKENVLWAIFAVNLESYPETRIENIPKEYREDGCFDCYVPGCTDGFYQNQGVWVDIRDLEEGFDFSQVPCCRWIVTS